VKDSQCVCADRHGRAPSGSAAAIPDAGPATLRSRIVTAA
jgi:hypothetical protein